MEFKEFNVKMQEHFKTMVESGAYLFVTDVSKDLIWETYMNSFPEGTNVVYKERREYDCQYCRQFMRPFGNLVTAAEDGLISIWDFQVDDPMFQQVIDTLSALVKSKPIANVFISREKSLGIESNRQLLAPVGDAPSKVIKWHHFHLKLPAGLVSRNTSESVEAEQGKMRQLKEVFKRGLDTITMEALSTVIELIEDKALYRGDEFRSLVQSFENAKMLYLGYSDENMRDLFAWNSSIKLPRNVAGLRNSAIGTLLVNLSEGMEVEHAVTAFEKIMAPANYKRPTALITKSMIKDAQNKVEELGIEASLGRRFAVVGDVTINNVLFANRDAKKAMNAFDELAEETTIYTKGVDGITDIPIDEFMQSVVPKVNSIELLVEGRHLGNAVSLIAPIEKDAPPLFKWDSGFSWAYKGDFTDSIKEKVKAAGGKVDAYLRCSLAWFNFDDLDIHVLEPNNNRIYFSQQRSNTSGELDIDMNANSGTTREAVENIVWSQPDRMLEGKYSLQVHNYQKRESTNVGFDVEMEFNGEIHQFHYDKAVRNDEFVTVAEFEWTREGGIKFLSGLPRGTKSKEFWGISTNQFRKVSMVMHSPNYWDDKVSGNKHHFFILEGCKNDDTPRGFFNEFLRDDLRDHRKVFEALGSKMKVAPSDEQLSGIGFSSTQRNKATVKVQGEITRMYNITF